MGEPRKDQPEQYVKIERAAELVNLSVGTVYQKTSKGEIPFWKLRGYGVRFLPSELEAWMHGELPGGFRGHVPAGALVA